MKKKISIKNRIIYMFASHFGRLTIAAILVLLGGILGTDGMLEIESQVVFWDYTMIIGALVIAIYLIVGMVYAIINMVKDVKGK